MRRLHDEHHGTKACNDADSCPPLRTGVRGIYFTAPLDAQSYCQELCMQGSRGVLSYPDAVLKGHAVHDLRQIMRGP